METKTYQIGEKKYFQKKLVMGQWEQILEQLSEVSLPVNADARAVAMALGPKLYICIAIALVEEGKSPKREIEEIEKIADEIHWRMDLEMIFQVIDDFFDCNPIASILERLKGVNEKIRKMVEKTGSKASLSSSREETSRSETKSSGDSVPMNADLSPNIN